MITVSGLCLRFGEHTVFSHYDLSLPDHGVVLLMGASGTGKTTLLRVLAGLQKPDAGSVHGLEGRRLAVAFQEPRLLPGRTARENVQLVSDALTADTLLSMLDMSDAAGGKAPTLSGGQQQRVSLARAFAYSRDAVLLDEPFSGLDENNRRRAASLIKTADLAVVVTHDVADAALLGACSVVYL